jgi:hypothetical protein
MSSKDTEGILLSASLKTSTQSASTTSQMTKKPITLWQALLLYIFLEALLKDFYSIRPYWSIPAWTAISSAQGSGRSFNGWPL